MGEVGRIASVMSFGLGIILPNGQTGYVHMTEIADWPDDEAARRERFPVGSLLEVEVVSTEGRWPRLRLANQGMDGNAAQKQALPSGTDPRESSLAAADAHSAEDPTLPEGDPDPFAETPLDQGERAEMLERLAEHMRPRLAEVDDGTRKALREAWNELRRQSTVEAFRAQAERLLAALDDVKN